MRITLNRKMVLVAGCLLTLTTCSLLLFIYVQAPSAEDNAQKHTINESEQQHWSQLLGNVANEKYCSSYIKRMKNKEFCSRDWGFNGDLY